MSVKLKRKYNSAVFLLFSFCLLLWAAYFLNITFGDLSAFSLANKVFPSLLFIALLGAGYWIVRKNPHLVWSPLPWFLGICAIYFGFGPLLYHFGTPESVELADLFYPVGELDLLRTNMLNAAGISLVLLGFQIGLWLFHREMLASPPKYDAVMMKRLLFCFLAIGISIKYFLAVPHRLGLLGWVLPGSIQYLYVFPSLAIIILFVMIHNGEKYYKIPLSFLIATELIIGLMSLAKLEVITVLIMTLLGIFLCKPSIRVFFAGVALIGLIYVFFLTAFVPYARLTVRLEGLRSQEELSTSISEYAQDSRLHDLAKLQNVQGWWSRLNYANGQTFAMESYDRGNSGNTFSLIPFTVVPRILYPEKPIMSIGQEFNEAVTGSDTSASSPGIFAEAYWNGGWLYVVLSCIYVGVVFAIFTYISIRSIPEWRLAYLPVALIGITMGLSPDHTFVSTFVGGFFLAIVYYVVIRIIVIPVLAEI